MFGHIVDSDWAAPPHMERFARRRFGDSAWYDNVNWSQLATATVQLGIGIANAAAHPNQGQSYTPQGNACPSVDANGTCIPMQSASPSIFSNIDPMVLIVGGLGLVLILTSTR